MAKSRTSGQGRPRGVPNKFNASLREMILGTLSDAGGREYLVRQADKNPAAFMVLVGKVLPMQMTGEEGGPVEMIVTGVRRAMEMEDSGC
jgi:hypothetical protein